MQEGNLLNEKSKMKISLYLKLQSRFNLILYVFLSFFKANYIKRLSSKSYGS